MGALTQTSKGVKTIMLIYCSKTVLMKEYIVIICKRLQKECHEQRQKYRQWNGNLMHKMYEIDNDNALNILFRMY